MSKNRDDLLSELNAIAGGNQSPPANAASSSQPANHSREQMINELQMMHTEAQKAPQVDHTSPLNVNIGALQTNRDRAYNAYKQAEAQQTAGQWDMNGNYIGHVENPNLPGLKARWEQTERELSEATSRYNSKLAELQAAEDAKNAPTIKAAEDRQAAALKELRNINALANTSTDASELDLVARRAAAEKELEEARAILREYSPDSIDYLFTERLGNTLNAGINTVRQGLHNANAYLVRVGNALQDASSEQERAMANSMYSGYITDPLTEMAFRQAAESGTLDDAGILKENKQVEDRMTARSERFAEDIERDMSEAKEGAGKFGQFLVDAGVGAVGLAADAAANLLLPGLGTVSMATRVFGDSAEAARKDGASVLSQGLVGTAKAALSVGIERIGGGAFEKVYGPTVTGEVVEDVISRLAKRPVGQNIIRSIADGVGEGFEEFLESILDPVVDGLLYSQEAKAQRFEGFSFEQQLSEALYEGLVGAGLGLAGAGVNIANGSYAQKNANIAQSQLGNLSTRQQQLASNVQVLSTTLKPGITDAQINSILASPDLKNAFMELPGAPALRGGMEAQRAAIREFANSGAKDAISAWNEKAAETASALEAIKETAGVGESSTEASGELNSQGKGNGKFTLGSPDNLVQYNRGVNEYGMQTWGDAYEGEAFTAQQAIEEAKNALIGGPLVDDPGYRITPEERAAAAKARAEDSRNQQIDSLVNSEPPARKSTMDVRLENQDVDAYYDLTWNDAYHIARDDYLGQIDKLNELIAGKEKAVRAREKELISSGKANALEARSVAEAEYDKRVDKAKKILADEKAWVDERIKNILANNHSSARTVESVRQEFSEEVKERVLSQSNLSDREKYLQIRQQASEYNEEYKGQFTDKAGNPIEPIEDNGGWRLDGNGKLVNEYYERSGENMYDSSEELDKVYSSRGLSNRKIGSSGDKGTYVSDEARAVRKYSSREDAPAGVGTKVNSDMRAANAAENARLDAESKPQYPLKPSQGANNAAPLKTEASSGTIEAKENGGNTNEREVNESFGPAAEGRTDAQTGTLSRSGTQVARSDEKTVRELVQRRSGSPGGSGGEGGSGGQANLLKQEVDLPSNRKGVSLKGVVEGNVSFGDNAYEVTKLNKRDKGLKNWAEKETGYNVRIVYGDVKINGKPSNGVRRSSNKEIIICVSSGKAAKTAVHEVLHHKFDVARGSNTRYSKAAETFAVLSAAIEKAPEKSNALVKVYNAVKAAYYDVYYEQAVNNYKAEGLSEAEIESKIGEIDDYVLSRCKEETMVALANEQTDNSVANEARLLSSDAQRYMISTGVVSKNFFDSAPYKGLAKRGPDVQTDVLTEAAPSTEIGGTANFAEDDSLPFVFGSYPASETASETQAVEETSGVQLEAAQEEQSADKTAKETNNFLLGQRQDSIKAKVKKVDDLKLFSETEAFKSYHGKSASYAANQELGKFKQALRDFANGSIGAVELREAFKGMKENKFLKLFSSDYIVKRLDTVVENYNKAVAENASKYDQRRYAASVDSVMDIIAARAQKINHVVSNQIDIANKLKEKPLSKSLLGKMAGAFHSMQLNAPTVFMMIDGFEKVKGGIGYAMRDTAENCAYVKAAEETNGRKFFSPFLVNKDYKSFNSNKSLTGVKVGNRELTQQEGVTLYKSILSLEATSNEKLDGIDGLVIGTGKDSVKYKFGDNPKKELSDLKKQLEKSFHPAAKSYMDAMQGMFHYYWPKMSATQKAVSGMERGQKGLRDYMPVRFAQDPKSIEDFSLAKQMEAEDFEYIDGRKPGIMKARSDTSSGYLVVEPCSVVVDRYISQASDYIAYAEYGNMLELMNTSSALAPGISESIEAAWGSSYSKWMKNYVTDMSSKREQNLGALNEYMYPVLRYLRRNLGQGALLANVSTPLKQGAAYFVANGIISADAMMQATISQRGISRGNALVENRRTGMDPSIGELLNSTDTWLGKLKAQDNAVGKATTWVSDWIANSDYKVVDLLFRATVIDVAKTHPGLSKDSAQFKHLVEQKFSEVMLRSQSASYKSISTDLQRTDNEWLKAVNMFRSQQAMEYNKVVQAIGEYSAAKGTPRQKEAGKYLRKTIGGQIASAIYFSSMTALVNALLHKGGKYRDEEDKVDPALVLKGMAFDTVETMSGVLWLGDALSQYLIDAVSGGKENEFYGIPLGALGTVRDVIEGVQTICEKPSLYNAKSLAGNIGNLTGVPVNNIYNIINALIMHTADITGNNEEHYGNILSYFGAKSAFESRLRGSGDKNASEEREAAYDVIRSLYDATGSTSFIPAELPNNFTLGQGDDNYVLSKKQKEAYLEARTEAYYDVVEDMISGKLFKNADTGTQAAMLEEAKNFANDAAKRAFYESIGIEYTSDDYKKVYEGTAVKGKDEDGNPIPDIAPIREQDIPQYLAWKVAYNEALDNKDYSAIDALLGSTSRLPTTVRNRVEYDATDNLLAVIAEGGSSKSYFAYTAARDKAAERLDVTSSNSQAVMDGLLSATMPNADRDILAELVLGKNKYAVYNAVSSNGGSIKDIPDLWAALDIDGGGTISQKEIKELYKNSDKYDDILEDVWNALVDSKPWPYS